MLSGTTLRIKKTSATDFRDNFKGYAEKAKGDSVILVENRRHEPKYFVDRGWLDTLLHERASILATLEILSDAKLTARLLQIAQTVDKDVRAGRLLSMEEVFGE